MENILQLQSPPRMPLSFDFLQQKIHNLEKSIQSTALLGERKKIKLSTQESIYFINPEKIIRCESQGNYCMIYLKNNSSILISKTLKYVSQLLSPKIFIRTHQSHLINISFIHRISKRDGFQIELENGTIIPVSRSGKVTVITYLHKL